MAYAVRNFKTKKALKEAHANGERIECFQPGGMFPLKTGSNTLEGPHYPAPHSWYAAVTIGEDCCLVPGSKIR